MSCCVLMEEETTTAAKERLFVWRVAIDGTELACRSVACGPGKPGTVELVAFGCSLPPDIRLTGAERYPVTLLVGRWRESARPERGWGTVRDVREEEGAGLRLRMSVSIPLDNGSS